MLTVTICVGSSCYLRGSDELARSLETLIERESLAARVELAGAFCMEGCSTGVSIRVGDRQYTQLRPENAESFFRAEIVPHAGLEGTP